jgi:hypothetical protein
VVSQLSAQEPAFPNRQVGDEERSPQPGGHEPVQRNVGGVLVEPAGKWRGQRAAELGCEVDAAPGRHEVVVLDPVVPPQSPEQRGFYGVGEETYEPGEQVGFLLESERVAVPALGADGHLHQ